MNFYISTFYDHWGWRAQFKDTDVCADADCSCRHRWPVGFGKTKDEAVCDLLNQLDEHQPDGILGDLLSAAYSTLQVSVRP